VNLACFPVQYQEKYYKDVSESKSDGLCKFAYWNGFVVGAACARLEPLNNNHVKDGDGDNETNGDGGSSEKENGGSNTANSNGDGENNQKRIYIMTLGVLAAYRGRTIGAQLIQSILDHFEDNKDSSPELKDVTEIALHVQISNDDALKFYKEKFGFEKGEMVENYYRRIDPPHCYKLFKKLR
jgi:ribosomal protein S18 acetylase RimI-like enzyme